jgi:hypothetical protein
LKYKDVQKNLSCEPRPFNGNMDNIQYVPNELNEYVNKYLSGEDFKFKDEKKDMDQICNTNSFKLNPSQRFLGMYMNNLTNFNGLLVYHSMGSGKSCSSIVMAEANKFKYLSKTMLKYREPKNYKIFVVVPKNVAAQYRAEIEGELERGCTNSCVIVGNEQKYFGKEKYVSEIYNITTHTTFINSLFIQTKSGDLVPSETLLNMSSCHDSKTLIIIDEIHTITREFSLNKTTRYKKLYFFLMYYARLLQSGNPAMKVVLLTGTPIYDNPFQVGAIMNLLRPRIPFPTTRMTFERLFVDEERNCMKNKLLFKYMTSGYVSYYKGGNPNAFPNRINHIMTHKMAKRQEAKYYDALLYELNQEKNKKRKKDVDVENDEVNTYFILSSQNGNIAFPENIMSDDEYTTVKQNVVGNFFENLMQLQPDQIDQYVDRYSPKLMSIVNLIENSNGPVFVYSRFVTHGILPIAAILKAFGWNFFGDSEYNPEFPTFAVWSSTAFENLNQIGINNISGDINQSAYITRLSKAFNNKENANGNLCKVIISSVTEGINLKRVSQVHVCEPWWNTAEIEQVITRGIRYCSHSDVLDKDVNVYYHLSTLISDLSIENRRRFSTHSIDQIMYETSCRKNKLNLEFEKCIKEVAVDCNLNIYGNNIKLEEVYFPNFDVLLYDRTNNKYYIKEDENTMIEVKLNIDDIYPPTECDEVENGKKLHFNSNSYVMTEDIQCFNTNNMNFEQLRTYALSIGEEEEAWNFCMEQYTKNSLLPQAIVKYNITSGSGVQLSKVLYNMLLEPERYDITKTIANKIENYIFDPKKIKNAREKYTKALGYDTSNLTFPQIEQAYISRTGNR